MNEEKPTSDPKSAVVKVRRNPVSPTSGDKIDRSTVLGLKFQIQTRVVPIETSRVFSYVTPTRF